MNPTGNLGNEEGKNRFPAAFVVGLIVVSAVVAVFLFATHLNRPRKPGEQPSLPFPADAQSYVGNIHFQQLALSESSNMLNEKFTYLDGAVSNDGARPIQAMEVLVEFRDPFSQVVLRETHRLISASGQPLAAGRQRNFELIFEHLPAEWNQQYPTIRVTGLVLQ